MNQEYLNSMHTDKKTLAKEFSWRKKPNEEISVNKKLISEYEAQGYAVTRESVRVATVSKEWPHDRLLENKVWTLFYKLGYPEISAGRYFRIKIERKNADPLYKQIDVLAKDEETVVVVECKSCRKPERRSLQKDIEEFANLKGPIARAVKKHYQQNGPKLKIVWLFVTNNIIWSPQDKTRAEGEKIQRITEKELRYYMQIAEHLKSAARYQFLAEFLKDQKIPAMERVSVPAIKGKLGGKSFYSFISTPRQMLKIAFVNHRSLNDPEGAPSYQRLVSKTRLGQITKFLEGGGFFPTNILVNFTQKCQFELAQKDEAANVSFGKLYLPSRYRSAWVIDGQHRLYGYAPLSEEYLDQNIMVVAFEKLDKTEEANLFVTINHEQKTVPKTLLDELEGELKWGSNKPNERIGAISSRLISVLNEDIGEPFYRRVTQQGITATDKICLTVPELKIGLKRSGLIGRSILRRKEYCPGPLSGVTDSETLERARQTLNGYFSQVKDSNQALWDAGRKGLLCTNIAVHGYLLLLSSLIDYAQKGSGLDMRELEPLALLSEIQSGLEPVLFWLNQATVDSMHNFFKVQFGSGGPSEYYFRLCQIVNSKVPDFLPEGFLQWVEEKSEERIGEADRKIKELNILVQKTIFNKLKEIYGTVNDAYLHEGVNNNEIMTKVYSKHLADNRQLPLENYFEFIEYKKIVERKENWPHFKEIFDIPEEGEKGRTKNLKWMERVNELRRIQAHATEDRRYKLEDLEYIDRIFDIFSSRLQIESIELP